MNSFIGILMIAVGVILGVYVGIYVCFIGGIVDIIEQIQSSSASAMVIAIGVLKIMFAGFFGWVAGAILVIPGWFMISSN